MKQYDWHTVPALSPAMLSHLRDGRVLSAEVDGKTLGFAASHGQWRAFETRCPHARGPLLQGWVNDQGALVCPWHRFAFDLETGRCLKGGSTLQIYPVRIDAHQVCVQLPRRSWWGW